MSVAGRIRELVRMLGAGEVSALLQQSPQVECAVRVAALVRAPIARFRRTQVSASLTEDAEVERRARVAESVGFPIGKLGAGRIASLFEEHAQVEPLNGSTRAIDQCVRAPEHLPAFPDHP
ncbi:MAG: hypothetical protein ACRDPM_24615 [Solirubrobacteraceae bacterium]